MEKDKERPTSPYMEERSRLQAAGKSSLLAFVGPALNGQSRHEKEAGGADDKISRIMQRAVGLAAKTEALVTSSSTPELMAVRKVELTKIKRRLGKGIQLQRRVTFSDLPDSPKLVPAYETLYGLHPSKFNFDRRGRMQPTAEALLELKSQAMKEATDDTKAPLGRRASIS
eukprot:TRINITY_DN8404_c0_g1_i1.p1 TRINITY_DN8404_c0_g1~~TRINITY_DN8404_c0_g1_i1.p1  ORF type:complete len:171 (-),score=41.12 TRINITY_DN8404_c0_g1_i1:341-853(-)